MVDPAGLGIILVAAFAGGAFGAALGALPAFSLAGFLVVVGELLELTGTAPDVAGGTALLGSTGFTAAVGLGPAFGPHVVFGGGVAAAAFAARKGYLDHEFSYHHAKDVTHSLGIRVDLLLVGGTFGVVGVVLAALSAGTFGALAGRLPWPGLPWDPISMSIVLSGFLHRISLGYPLIGHVRGDILDMSPFERGERRRPVASGSGDASAGTDSVGEAPGEGRYLVEPWLPHQSRWSSVGLLGAVVGVFAAFVTYATGSPLLAFGVCVVSLVFLVLGWEVFPVTHHMALPSSVLVVGLAGGASAPASAVSPAGLVLAGAAMGAFAGLVGELAQRVLYAHADTHLDPPAVALVVSTFLIALLDTAGIVSQGVVPAL